MTCGIYGIFSANTNECLYIGQSKNIEARYRQHVSKLKNRRSGALIEFVEWFHRRGANENAMELRLLEECSDENSTRNELEAKWFDVLRPRFYGKVPSLSETWNHSEETRKKISEAVSSRNLKIRQVWFLNCSACGLLFCCRNATGKKCLPCRSVEALLPHRNKIVVKANRTHYEQECDYCQSSFFTPKRTTRFCSPTCASQKQYSHIKQLSYEELYKLYWKEHKSAREIGELLGCSGQTVRNKMRNLGVPLLPERGQKK